MNYDPKQLRQFLSLYQEYVDKTLKPNEERLRETLNDWRVPSYWAAHTQRSTNQSVRSPIHRTKVRIKRPESVVDKVYRKGSSFPDGLAANSFFNMYDTLGARIIVYFLSDLPVIDRHLRELDEIELSSSQPPVAYLAEDLYRSLKLDKCKREDKDSGYNSIHYIARFRNPLAINGAKMPWFEIQLRTLAEDVWGEVEHMLGYKPDKKTNLAVKNQFRVISKQLSAIDEHFDFLHRELSRFQEEGRPKDPDLLNAENLPGVLSEAGVGCAQGEIDGMLKVLNSRGVDTVELFREAATKARLDLVKGVYRERKGRAPGDFETVACLAAIAKVHEIKEQRDLVESQILFTDYWDEYKHQRKSQVINGSQEDSASQQKGS